MNNPLTQRLHHRFAMLCAFAFVCVAFIAHPVNAKVISGRIRLRSEDTDIYLGKFSFSPSAIGTIEGDLSVPGTQTATYFDNFQHMLKISLFDDRTWEQYQAAIRKGSLCVDRMRLANFHYPITPKRPSQKRSIGQDFAFRTQIAERPKSHYLFAVIHDCMLENYPAKPPELQYRITFLNGGSHLPSDEDGMIATHVAMLGLLGAFGVYLVKLLIGQYREFRTVHLVTLLLGVAFMLQMAAVGMELIHLLVYKENGMGLRFRHTWFALDFFSQICQQFSELIVAFIFICLAAGWTLTNGFSMARFLATPRAVIMVLIAGLCNLVLQYMGRKYEDDFAQFHNHEHAPGRLLMLLRIVLCTSFVLTIARSFGSTLVVVSQSYSPQNSFARILSLFTLDYGQPGSLNDAEPELRTLVYRILVLGTVWFSAFPVSGILCHLLHPASRHAFVTAVSLVAQCTALCFLVYSFLDPNSQIFKSSSLRSMGTVFSSSDIPVAASRLNPARYIKTALD